MPSYTTTVIRTCLLVLAGGFAAQHSRLLINSDLYAALFVATLLLFVIRRVRAVAFFLVGFVLFVQAGNAVIDARLDAKFAGDSMLARVRIADFPKVSGASVALLIEPVYDQRLPSRSRVTWFEPSRIPMLGEIWEFELRLRRPHGNSNPGAFSLENWMFREKLHAAGYVVAGERNRLLRTGVLSPIETYRQGFVDRAGTIGGSSASVLAAIGVGSRHLISRQQWDRYAKTGSSHLMAISGLHIGLAAAAAFFLVVLLSGIFRLPGNHLDLATIAAILMATSYALVSGFAVPSQRATIMLGLAAIAFLSRRRAVPGRIVASVALLLFVLDPISLMMPGFVLSFGAVVVLLWFARSYWLPRPGLRFFQLITMQFILLLGLMPLTVFIFQRIAFAAPVVNLITVPVFSFITVPLTLASMLLNPVWAAASSVSMRVAAVSIRIIERFIDAIASLSIADTTLSGIDGFDGFAVGVVLVPALWVVLPRGWPGRGVAILGVLALLLNKPPGPQQSCVDAHVLEVGQGLAVVVQSAGHTLIFDTGASYRSGGSAAEQYVLPFLRFKGIEMIDWLVISHADDDHAGGLPALVDGIGVGRIFAGEELSDVGRPVAQCKAGQFWHVDGIEYRFLHPGPDDSHSGNDSSCVLSISAGDHRLVLTGDIEGAGERSLLTRLPFTAASVVLIPHHGSLTSSSPSLVNRLRPDIAIASVGYGNRWGFPKQAVMQRWRGAGAAVFDTATSGSISLRLCKGDGVSRLREERSQKRRFWHESKQL